ncbi:conserved hypothetical protein [Rubrivivax sp. A210]|nr:conserved hypothetical protein [Rubrivivax sp. A210]
MLVLALVPTISRAMASQQGPMSWVEICTPQGMQLVAIADGEESQAHTSGHLDHCALCGLSADAGPPPVAAPRPPQLPGGTEVPRLFLQAPYTLPAWRSAQPRAPPARA